MEPVQLGVEAELVGLGKEGDVVMEKMEAKAAGEC